jgi:hypothetical protein
LAAVCVAWVGEEAGGQAQSRKSRRGSSPGPSRSGEATPLHYHSPGQRFAALREPVLASASAWSSRRGVLARMSGSGSGSGGGGARGQSGPVPASARKLVQGLKEIVNRPDAEIYAALRECGMDPDEAVSRLLCQGSISCHSPFPHSFMCRLGR